MEIIIIFPTFKKVPIFIPIPIPPFLFDWEEAKKVHGKYKSLVQDSVVKDHSYYIKSNSHKLIVS